MVKPCPRCKERGGEGQLLKAPGDTTESCLQCGYEVVVKVSDPKPAFKPKWRCEPCNKTFKGKKWFDNHMAKHHPDAPPYVERETPYIQADQCGLEEFSIHNKKQEPVKVYFSCPVCQKPFDKKIQLDGHMATHSERPTDSMGVLEQAEKVLRKNIVTSMDGQKDKLKEARRHVLEAIEVLL